MIIVETTTACEGTFPQQASAVLRQFRDALLRLFDTLPSGMRRSRDRSAYLELTPSLAGSYSNCWDRISCPIQPMSRLLLPCGVYAPPRRCTMLIRRLLKT